MFHTDSSLPRGGGEEEDNDDDNYDNDDVLFSAFS